MEKGVGGELTERLAEKHLKALFEQKRRTRFDGDLQVKYVFADGQIVRVHFDNHDVIDGPAALKKRSE